MPREIQLTPSDEAWLAAMDKAMYPVPMVSVAQYCAAIDSADYVIRENYRIRMQRRRLLAFATALHGSRDGWRLIALGLGVVAAVLGAVLAGRLSG